MNMTMNVVCKSSEVDSRFDPVKNAILRMQREEIGYEIWDVFADRRLRQILKAAPGASETQLVECVVWRFLSVGVVLGAHPKTWLNRLTEYQSGPLDRYNKAMDPEEHSGLKQDFELLSTIATNPANINAEREQRHKWFETLASYPLSKHQLVELLEWERENIDGVKGTHDWPGWEPLVGKRPR